jgi:hypothetical protein
VCVCVCRVRVGETVVVTCSGFSGLGSYDPGFWCLLAVPFVFVD